MHFAMVITRPAVFCGRFTGGARHGVQVVLFHMVELPAGGFGLSPRPVFLFFI